MELGLTDLINESHMEIKQGAATRKCIKPHYKL